VPRIVSMVGCNAIGKTTAAGRYVARYRGLLQAVLMDVQAIIGPVPGERRRCLESKGTEGEKAGLVDAMRSSPTVTLMESARTTHLRVIGSDDPVIVVTCTPELYERHMRDRCLRLGKRYREDYWTQVKLTYECHRRYVNFVGRVLDPSQVRYFVIADQARDWPAVDEAFARLFRQVHNEMVQERLAAVHRPACRSTSQGV